MGPGYVTSSTLENLTKTIHECQMACWQELVRKSTPSCTLSHPAKAFEFFLIPTHPFFNLSLQSPFPEPEPEPESPSALAAGAGPPSLAEDPPVPPATTPAVPPMSASGAEPPSPAVDALAADESAPLPAVGPTVEEATPAVAGIMPTHCSFSRFANCVSHSERHIDQAITTTKTKKTMTMTQKATMRNVLGRRSHLWHLRRIGSM